VRVAIDYTSAVRQGAGIGRYTRGLVGALADIGCDDQYVLFCAGGRPSRAAWPPNFRVRCSAIPSRWLNAAWNRLGIPLHAEVLTGNCDLFHSPDFVLPPLRAARGIVTVHDLSFMRLPSCADPALRAFLERSVPRAVGAARLVLADSWNTRKDLIDLLQVHPDKVTVVAAGVDKIFSPVTDSDRLDQARTRYRLPDRFLISVGTLEPRKNYARLISAFARMRKQTGLPHQLVIVGRPGWLFDEIHERVRVEGMGEYVHFLGFVPDVDLAALYTLADLMVFPSLYEGFGIPPLEAMACGTPVVSSDNSSLPESVGTAALTVNAEDTEGISDAIGQVLCDDNFRARLIELGRTRAAQFTWHSAARGLLAAYRQAMELESTAV
jgi:glycosyltransferase involved in cell wall biosynthesis